VGNYNGKCRPTVRAGLAKSTFSINTRVTQPGFGQTQIADTGIVCNG
jgi:hypothetical protein